MKGPFKMFTHRNSMPAIAVVFAVTASIITTAHGKLMPGSASLSPPEPLPVQVKTGFHLLDLTFVNERNETFNADIYLDFTWRDPRLAFAPQGKDNRKSYTENAAEDKLKEIWWPDIEFVNTSQPQITNRSLVIHSDGTVDYTLGLSSQFRSNLDLRRFPFDTQILDIKIQSFLWQNNILRFVPDRNKCGFSMEDTFDDLKVKGVITSAHSVHLSDYNEDYSEFGAFITAQRNWMFYIWRVFFPAVLIMAISCTVYFMEIDDLYSRVNIGLTCLLACIATQFAISFNLPRIPYLTPIDKLYMITYGCIALGAGVSTIEVYLHNRNHPHTKKCNRFACWFVPLLYALLLAIVVLV